jgi:Domain of unknown function DUF1828.
MTKELTVSEIETAVRGLSVARATSLGIEITLPVLFPGGDLVTVTVNRDGESEFIVHDSSAAMMFLASVGITLSSDTKKRLRHVVAKYGCEMAGDRVMRRCTRDQIGVAATIVANASRAIGDHALELRRRVEHEFRELVTDRVRAVVGNRIRLNEQVIGASGRSYRVSNVILAAKEETAIAYIEPIATRSAVANHFAEFADLDENQKVEKISVFDENSDIRPEDVKLLSKVGNVVPLMESEKHLRRFAA